jgi:hypothetical protein
MIDWERVVWIIGYAAEIGGTTQLIVDLSEKKPSAGGVP